MSDIELPHPLLIHENHQTNCPFDAKFSATRVPFYQDIRAQNIF